LLGRPCSCGPHQRHTCFFRHTEDSGAIRRTGKAAFLRPAKEAGFLRPRKEGGFLRPEKKDGVLRRSKNARFLWSAKNTGFYGAHRVLASFGLRGTPCPGFLGCWSLGCSGLGCLAQICWPRPQGPRLGLHAVCCFGLWPEQLAPRLLDPASVGPGLGLLILSYCCWALTSGLALGCWPGHQGPRQGPRLGLLLPAVGP
jgi:hypothetical protein